MDVLVRAAARGQERYQFLMSDFKKRRSWQKRKTNPLK
jgi:hypothetical protein